jgi:hypothetical protein
VSYRRHHVVERAITVLDAYGWATVDAPPRRGAGGPAQRAPTTTIKDKQTLLAAVADEILARGERPVPDGDWPDQVTAICAQLRDAMLA